MSEAAASGSNEPEAQRKERNSESDRNEFDTALANQQQADICKLDMDCFGEAFDYLESQDLVAVGQTCKFLNQVAGYIYSRKYFSLPLHVYFRNDREEFKCFPQFIRKFHIVSKEDAQTILNVQSKLCQLKQIEVIVFMTLEIVESIKGILSKVEYLNTTHTPPNRYAYNMAIDLCPNLKRLYVNHDIPIRKYPSLQKLEINNKIDTPLVPILELNPTIRKLGIQADYLISNGESMKTADIALDDLAIKYESSDCDLESLFKLLNDLYALERFKRLYIHFENAHLPKGALLQLNSINKMLVGLVWKEFGLGKELCALSNLEEIYFSNGNIDKLAASLPKLKQIYIKSFSNNILPFIRQTVTLKRIRFRFYWENMKTKEDEIIDLRALNKERQKLANGRNLKVTIYVSDSIYVATKRAMNGATECGLIRMTRAESFEWNEWFELFRIP